MLLYFHRFENCISVFRNFIELYFFEILDGFHPSTIIFYSDCLLPYIILLMCLFVILILPCKIFVFALQLGSLEMNLFFYGRSLTNFYPANLDTKFLPSILSEMADQEVIKPECISYPFHRIYIKKFGGRSMFQESFVIVYFDPLWSMHKEMKWCYQVDWGEGSMYTTWHRMLISVGQRRYFTVPNDFSAFRSSTILNKEMRIWRGASDMFVQFRHNNHSDEYLIVATTTLYWI